MVLGFIQYLLDTNHTLTTQGPSLSRIFTGTTKDGPCLSVQNQTYMILLRE